MAASGGKRREIVEIGLIGQQRIARRTPFRREHFQECLNMAVQGGGLSWTGIFRWAALSRPNGTSDSAEMRPGRRRHRQAAPVPLPRRSERCGSSRLTGSWFVGLAAAFILACPASGVLASAIMTRNTVLKE